jgi:transcription elongation factor Elf1
MRNRPFRATIPSQTCQPELPARLRALARQLVQIKQRAEVLGLFTGDRELLECPYCGLMEDVTFEGFLVTYPKDSENMKDSGLRFRSLDDTTFQCPACGASCHLPAEEESEARHG